MINEQYQNGSFELYTNRNYNSVETDNNEVQNKNGLNLKHELVQIREQLRQCDPECNGHLKLTMNDETGVALLCINSPSRKNAFSGFMMAQFSDLLDQLEQWDKVRYGYF